MKLRMYRAALLAALLVSLSLVVVGQPLPPPGANPIHALRLTVDEGGQIAVAGYDALTVGEPLASESPARSIEALQVAQTRDLDLVSVQLIDDTTSAVVYQTTVTLARWIRGEFAIDPADLDATGADGSNIDGHFVPWRNRTLSVKVPVIPGANRLAVSLLGGTRASALIDIRTAAAQFGLRGPRDVTVIPLDGYDNGDPDNRVDIVILGDGYTAAQQSVFEADAQALADGMFDLSPYSRYRKYFNVVAVFGSSTQSGVDQPPYVPGCSGSTSYPITCCPPGSGNNEAMNGTYKDTRYNATYCYDGISRLMVATNYAQMYGDADDGYPEWDEIFLIANDSVYGGSGGAIAAVARLNVPGEPLHTLAAHMVQHEVGHSFVRLDDEYDTTTPGYPPCSDKGRGGITTPCRPNVTDQTTRALIKWSRWIAPPTPVPTAADLGPDAGLWLGAHYSSHTYYRPCYNCTMKSLGQEFGVVAGEQLPVVLYTGGWEGESSYWTDLGEGSGIDIVEPGTVAPATGATVNIASGASQTFSLTVLSPTGAGGENTRVRWKVDGTLVQEANYANLEVSSFTFTPIIGGSYTVMAEAVDVGGVLHSSQANVSRTTLTWGIDAEGYAGLGTELIVNGGFETPNPAVPAQPDGWTAKNASKSKIKCNKTGKTFSFEGECAYQFKGVAGTAVKLKQTTVTLGDAGDAYMFSGQFDTVNLTAGFAATAKIKLTDGTKHKLSIDGLARDKAKTDPYFARQTGVILGIESADVAKIVVQLKFPDAGGKLYADAISLEHYDEYLTSPPPPGGRLLPPGFKGN